MLVRASAPPPRWTSAWRSRAGFATKSLAEPAVQADLARYQLVQLGLEHDDAWALFESLPLAATPSFVVMSPDGTVLATLQGARDRDAV